MDLRQNLPHRVVYVTDSTSMGGAELNGLAIIKKMREWGIVVSLISSEKGELWDAFKNATDRQLIVRFPYPRKVASWLHYWCFMRNARKFLKQNSNERMALWVGDMYPLWAAVQLKRSLPNLEVLSYWQGQYTFDNDACIQKWLRYGAAKADVLLASEPVAAHMNALNALPKSVQIVNPRVDLKLYDRSLYDREEIRRRMSWSADKVAICLGQVHEGKGQRWLVEEFLENKELYENWRLVIVGPMRAEEEAKFIQLIQKDKQKKVEFLGRREDIPELLAAPDLAIFPGTASESFGMAPLEAASMGLPLLLTGAGALAYTFENYPGMVTIENRPALIKLWHSLDENNLKQFQSAIPQDRINRMLSCEKWEENIEAVLTSGD